MLGGMLTIYGGGGTILPFVGDITNPANDVAANDYIKSITGITLDTGRVRRLNQALTNAGQYLIDKNRLLNALIYGANGGGDGGNSTLNLALPNGVANIPAMNSLAAEYRNKYNMLLSQGIPGEIAKRQSEEYVKLLLNDRIASFAPAFPGLIDKGAELTPLFQKTINDAQFNVLTTGVAGSDVSNAPMENVQDVLPKYQKRKEKKRTKRKKYKQYYRENKKK